MEAERQNGSRDRRWGGNLIVLVISLLLALVVWGVMKLSASYRYLYHYQVEISSPMEGRVLKSVSKDPVTFRGSSSGFFLLRYKYSLHKRSNILSFRVNPSVLKPLPGVEDAFYFNSLILKDWISEMLDESVTVDDIVSDTLVFIIPKSFQKKVPVCLHSDLTFSPQYMPLEMVALVPDSVYITGEESIVSGIDSVFTEKVMGRNLTRTFQGVAGIEPIPGVEISENETVYSLKVGRYVERAVEVDIQARNVPPGSRMVLVPSSVKAVFREEYGRKKPLEKEDFIAYVDYGEASLSESGKAKVKMDWLPEGVLKISLDPPFVDRIIVE